MEALNPLSKNISIRVVKRFTFHSLPAFLLSHFSSVYLQTQQRASLCALFLHAYVLANGKPNMNITALIFSQAWKPWNFHDEYKSIFVVEQRVICITADERENTETFIQQSLLCVNIHLQRTSAVPSFIRWILRFLAWYWKNFFSSGPLKRFLQKVIKK